MTSTEQHEVRALLDEELWTEQQIAQITEDYRDAARRLCLDDEQQTALLTAIAQRVDGTLDRDELVAVDTAAQQTASEARLALRSAVIADVHAGMSESEASRRYGITRMTVRDWIGK